MKPKQAAVISATAQARAMPMSRRMSPNMPPSGACARRDFRSAIAIALVFEPSARLIGNPVQGFAFRFEARYVSDFSALRMRNYLPIAFGDIFWFEN